MLLYPDFEQGKKRTRTVDNNKKGEELFPAVKFMHSGHKYYSKCLAFTTPLSLFIPPKLLLALQIQE